jgi:hypothetical protein
MSFVRNDVDTRRATARTADRGAVKAALVRLMSLQSLLVTATIVVGLCQLAYAYFARSPAVDCITERSIARDAATRATLAFGATRRRTCVSDPVALTRRP